MASTWQSGLRRLGVDRATAFFRAAREQSGVIAISIVNDELDQGRELASILADGDGGFFLEVRQDDAEFEIEFGCALGPLAGDGGTWTVTFDAEGGVSSLSEGDAWIA